ncbi:MAG: HDOD domain-containing protein [Deltaproteobacteria bacterium]|nr:MAG: HDOD domain-containing protein [Deltaproteobacteria bacterium]
MSPNSKSVDDILAKVDNLPTLPLVAMQVGELVNDPRSTVAKVAQVMRRDPSLSAKVLRLVNSSYYAIPGGVSDVGRAISFVGFNSLYQLVLSVSVMQALRTPAGSQFDAGGLWLHSLAVGACAEVLANHIGHKDPGTCFTAGLLHDIGKIALAIADTDRFGEAIDRASANGMPMASAEQEVGLPPHDRVGSRLAKRWKFPQELLLPIEHHHTHASPDLRRRVGKNTLAIVDIVAVADRLCRTFALGNSGSPAPEEPADDALATIGLGPLDVDTIYSELMRRLEQSKTFLQLVDAA